MGLDEKTVHGLFDKAMYLADIVIPQVKLHLHIHCIHVYAHVYMYMYIYMYVLHCMCQVTTGFRLGGAGGICPLDPKCPPLGFDIDLKLYTCTCSNEHDK